MKRSTLVRLATFLATTVAVWGVLSLFSDPDQSNLSVGDLAARQYVAQRAATVDDTEETERLIQEARNAVPPERADNPEIEQQVQVDVTDLFDDVAASVVDQPPDLGTDPTLPPSTTSTTDPNATTTTVPVETVVLSGLVFLDVNADGTFEPDAEGPRPDRGMERITVTVESVTEDVTVMTSSGGVWSLEVLPGEYLVTVDTADSDVPVGFFVGTDNHAQLVTCTAGDECSVEAVAFQPFLGTVADVAARISNERALAVEASTTLVATAADDVIGAALGEPSRLNAIELAVTARILQEFGLRVQPEDLPDVRQRARSSPPAVFYDITGRNDEASQAAGEIVATFIQANNLIDDERTAELQDEAEAAVRVHTVEYDARQIIVDEGVPLAQLHIDAIDQTGSAVITGKQEGGLLAIVAVLIGVLGLYLATFRPEFWSRPRMVALLGIMIVLAAAAVRATVILQSGTSWYVLPAVAFGFMTAVLFDSRIAVLMALAVGVITAVGARDIGVSVFSILATMAPIPFVSSVSSRGAFRKAVIYSSLTAAVAAAATSWFFHSGPNDTPFELFGIDFTIPFGVIGPSVLWAFGISAVASLVGLAALQFFESAFDITTTLSLLDLTDRNHEALQLLQEKAFGTFNHSLMVGTLSHAAARAINANALLARAMAYYHDLGKTENPTYFIENQFGIPNPHDLLTPQESAEIIRRHVSDGIALARQHKIPSDVVTGIVSHHGEGIMRYFYEKAKRESDGDVDPSAFRHIGHKPKTAESAIVMMADSLEAACRAVFQTEEPSPEAIEKVVDRVVNEKLDDGQLDDSPLTLADLSKIRSAFLESLVGHYHQRIAYPNFPGS